MPTSATSVLSIHAVGNPDSRDTQEQIDPRLSISSRPTRGQLEEGLHGQLAVALHAKHPPKGDSEKDQASPEILYIDWEKGDTRNPANFSYTRKWIVTLTAAGLTGLSEHFPASAGSTYAMGYPSMISDLNCTMFQATVGLSLYALGFSVVPLVTAALSEEFGRQPLYIISTIIFLLMHLGVALAKNIQSVLVFRFIAGAAGSTGATMVGGTVADVWSPSERGLPMAVFAVAAIGGTGLGPVGAGWIEMDTHLQWRWIQWIHFIATGVYLGILLMVMKETRSSVLLTRMARKIRKDTGDLRYRARIEDERGSLRSLIFISCTRPLHLLITEPVVASFSLWIGFAWGILYSLLESIAPAFQELHHFNQGQVGTVFITMTIGSILGFTSNLYQERLYQRNFLKRGREARLYSACFAGILFPVSMFIYAWTSFEKVNWIGMSIGIVLFIWADFIIYLAVFTYLADCYGPFASSALAGQSMCRNLAGFAFPLFTTQMYARLTFPWTSTLFACIAVLLAPIPFILFHWGPKIRARSKFSKRVDTIES